MQIVKYPLASSNWTEEEYEAINEIVKSGQFTMGKKVRCFERKFAEYLGVKHAVMVNSGSSANLIAFQSLLYKTKNPLKAGDSVIVPAVGWSTTYFPLHQSGLKLKFVDIDQRTFNIDLEQVERAAEDPNVKAICAVNLLGRSCQFDRLLEIADKNDLVILEDNCEGFGASFNQKKTGTFGLCGTHSFFFSHHLVTMEGGMAVTNDDEIYDIMLCLRAHGWTRELPKNSHLQIKGSEFTKKFRFVLPGYNLRPLEMEAAIGLIQLEKVESMLSFRRKNAQIFYEKMSTIDRVQLPEFDCECSWFGYALVVEDLSEEKREHLAERLLSAGIETRPILSGNFLKNPVISHLNYEVYGPLTIADKIDEAGLFFGAHCYDLRPEIEAAGNILKEFLDEN